MIIAVVPNLTKRKAHLCTEETVSILESRGCEVLLKSDLFDGNGVYRETEENSLRSCDIFIAIGGDGTIIHTAKLAAKYGKPILGINAGTLGFTAGLEPGELSLLHDLLDGNYREENRLMVSVQMFSQGKETTYQALNDAVVSGELTSIIDYWMALGENAGYRCRADGFIVATPTGSTAYSLSAGGPVIQPDMDCLVYTPVCPHALFNRSVVFGGDTRLTVTIPDNMRRLFLTVDGETPTQLHTGDKLVFSRSEQIARFLKLAQKDFYDVLNQKIIETR
ncbi:MAG: NAD(+)/NADH kinase [Acutalibacter sp.]|nr:NAD(+)/NADH kinase [Acutalibacter sp.]